MAKVKNRKKRSGKEAKKHEGRKPKMLRKNYNE